MVRTHAQVLLVGAKDKLAMRATHSRDKAYPVIRCEVKRGACTSGFLCGRKGAWA